MTRADYVYSISYPNYSGYRVEHDPLYTIYFAPTTAARPSFGGFIVLVALGGIIIAAVAFILRRKGPKQLYQPRTEQPPPPPSTA